MKLILGLIAAPLLFLMRWLHLGDLKPDEIAQKQRLLAIARRLQSAQKVAIEQLPSDEEIRAMFEAKREERGGKF